MTPRLFTPRAEPPSELHALALLKILDADSRPTLVLDLDPNLDLAAPRDLALEHTINPVFSNEALQFHERLCESLFAPSAATRASDNQHNKATTFAQFKAWAESATQHDGSKDIYPVGFFYNGVLWTGSTIRRRWRLISGNQAWQGPDLQALMPTEHAGKAAPDMDDGTVATHTTEDSVCSQSVFSESTTASHRRYTIDSAPNGSSLSSYAPCISLSSPEMAVADWTVAHPKGLLSSHIQHARSVHWAQTPLGPMESWSREFRQAANLCMANPHPAALFWGSELTMLYNEAYAVEVAGKKHPSLMGTGFSGPFAELWDYAGPIFAECARTGTSVRKDYDYLPIDRKGIIEETFFNWSFTPLYGGTDRILGFYNAPFETTQEVVAKRRMQIVTQLGESTAQAKTVKDFWPCVIACFEDYHYDIPFAFLYSMDDANQIPDAESSTHSAAATTCRFQGSLGIPEGHIATPPQLDLNGSREGFIPSFREAIRNRGPTLLHTRDGSLPEPLIADFQWRGFGDPCHQAIVFPVRPTNEDRVLAVLVLGVAPRRIYDDEYEAFLRMLNRQLATSLASIILYESEVRRSREAAALAAKKHQLLEEELRLQANRMRQMAEFSPLGMFFISPEGVLLEANEQFFEMTGLDKECRLPMSWTDCVASTSQESISLAWAQMRDKRTSWSGELLLKSRPPSQSQAQEIFEHWVLFTAHVETQLDGSLKSVMGSITDISHLKWAQNLQARQLEEAEEMRRQQNEFIDITSHEIRNPLSAILQCADDISSSLADADSTYPTKETLAACHEAAATISLCVHHQKSIVDDVLTISKLHSNLLQITPSVTQPETILRRAVKMFESEALAKDVRLIIDRVPGQEDQDAATSVVLDPSRVLQILVNLISNAIKFTVSCTNRVITVSTCIQSSPPEETDVPEFHFAPSDIESRTTDNASEWGRGRPVYVCFKVNDTGCGLAPREQTALFQKFKQASPRTHAKYGGSGLGLFISKKLTELHGGRIGVASTAGHGTMFLFYVQARTSDVSTPARITEALGHMDIHSSSVAAGSRRLPPSPRRTKAATEPRTPMPPNEALLNTHILVVEDNLINQRVLVKQLRKLGCHVSAANDGMEALDFLNKTHFCVPSGASLSLILMDLEMPNMDGLTCVREIRAMERCRKIASHVPVVAVTANVRNTHIEAAKEAGMDGIVLKPFSIRSLLQRIEPWIPIT
ncbi:ethylene receptor [Cordyceps militaris]|uniref:histidine kinase n=1 Tax=Cordyceps militaris TaxID=73501 RepID=A0A2H4SH53_CORMI|nr:ethylene receptor [Cordyceps militaris]